MIVRLNDRELELFSGAKVRDVLLKYSKELYKKAVRGDLRVVDKRDNPTGLDGAVTDGQQLYIREEPGDDQ